MNRKGGAIVESAMIMPLVIMSVSALICMMIYFHTQLCERVDMHIMLRAESGSICGNISYGNETDSSMTVYKETQQIYSKGIVKSDKWLLLYGREKELYARKYLVDEVRFIRMTGIINYEK